MLWPWTPWIIAIRANVTWRACGVVMIALGVGAAIGACVVYWILGG